MPVLIVKYPNGPRTISLPEGKPLYVGRDPACDIVAPSPLVSRRHAVFLTRNGVSGVKDLDSNNGTRINGFPIHSAWTLSDGDLIRLHELEIEFSDPETMPSEAAKRELYETDTVLLDPDHPEMPASRREPAAKAESDTKYLTSSAISSILSEEKPIEPTRGPATIRIIPGDADAAESAAPASDAAPLSPSPDPGGGAESRTIEPVDPATEVVEPPVSEALLLALERRLGLYDELAALADQRRLMRMQKNGLSREAAAELLRQDGEMEVLPTAQQAGELLEEMYARHADQAASGTRTVDPEMRTAEELAVEQWILIREHNREELGRIFWEAYQMVADEPLAEELALAGIYHVDLIGGAAYLYLVEELLKEARADRAAVGDGGQSDEERLSRRVADLVREASFLERGLTDHFWRVYREAARHFLSRPEPPSLAVRAFLRFGVLGFGPCWMSGAVRNYIIGDCSGNILEHPDLSHDATSILYMDEYLPAIVNLEIPPYAGDGAGNAGSSPLDAKAAKAWRRLANTRSYRRRLQDLLLRLGRQVMNFERDSHELDTRIARIESERRTDKSGLYAVMKRKQALEARQESLLANLDGMQAEIDGDMLSAVEEGERRFRERVHPLPPRETIIAAECEAIREQIKRLTGFKEAFLPLVVRAGFLADPDDVNDRVRTADGIAVLEARDPEIFMKTVIPAKKRAHRIDMRFSPIIVLLPFVGVAGHCRRPRAGMDGGLLLLPIRLGDPRAWRQVYGNLLADFRWETSRREAGLGVIGSDTLVGQFMKIRWDWRAHSRERRERGMIHNDMSDKENWRKVYEVYLTDAESGAERLFGRNPDLYEAIVGRYIQLPEGAPLLRKP